MAIDMIGSRSAAQAYLMGDECYLLRPTPTDDGAGGVVPGQPTRIGPLICGFAAASGNEQDVADQVAQRGSYRLRLPIEIADPDTGNSITLAETDQIEIFGRVYAITWLPPVHALSLFRKVGLEEA
jgi:hypothetical protein